MLGRFNKHDNIEMNMMNIIFLLQLDLDALTVQTTSCVEEGGTVIQGGECEYSCQVSGMDHDDSFTIAKASIQYFTLGLDG